MNLTDLDADELTALIGLIAYVIDADGVVDDAEATEVSELAHEMGIEDLAAQIDMARRLYPTREMMFKAAARVSRADSRDLIRTVLLDVAGADGERGEAENQLLEELASVWR